MASLDLFALIRAQYTPSDPPVTKETEPDPELARKAKRWVVREKDLRELLALATTEAVTRANELITSRYPAGSMHCQIERLLPFSNKCEKWHETFEPKAKAEIEKFQSVVPTFDELEAYASQRT